MNGLFSIPYMGCHPNPIDELIFFKMVGIPPTSYKNTYRAAVLWMHIHEKQLP
jgi:hypothetical protein